jgi:segregation and condensation protein B
LSSQNEIYTGRASLEEMMKSEEFVRIVEALIFASESPLKQEKLVQAYELWASENDDQKTNPQEAVASAILQLNHRYSESGSSFRVRRLVGGYQMYTLPEFHRWISEFLFERRPLKLSVAALETLSIIAYRQPVVKSDIDNIRGVDSEGPLHSLLERGLIKASGRKEAPGRPYLFHTAPDFLLHFGLNALSELPPEEELMAVLKTSRDSLGAVRQHKEFFEEAVSAESTAASFQEAEGTKDVDSGAGEAEGAVEETIRQEDLYNHK